MEKFINEQILTGEFISWDLVSNVAIAWLIVLALFFGIITTILSFHWKNYGITEKTLKQLRKIYFSVSFVFIIMIIVSARKYFSL